MMPGKVRVQKTIVGKGVSVGTESKRKISMKNHKEIREGIGTGAGICAMVGIGIGKCMNSANAFLLDASKARWWNKCGY